MTDPGRCQTPAGTLRPRRGYAANCVLHAFFAVAAGASAFAREAAPPPTGVPQVPAHPRSRVPTRARPASDPRQLPDPQARRRRCLACPASALPSALHPHQQLLAETRRALVSGAHREGSSPRRLPYRARSHRRHWGLPRRPERRPQSVRLDRLHRRQPREGRAL